MANIFPFLDLARETRDQIYTNLFPDDTIHTAILSTNKLIHAEAEAAMYQKRQMSIKIYEDHASLEFKILRDSHSDDAQNPWRFLPKFFKGNLKHLKITIHHPALTTDILWRSLRKIRNFLFRLKSHLRRYARNQLRSFELVFDLLSSSDRLRLQAQPDIGNFQRDDIRSFEKACLDNLRGYLRGIKEVRLRGETLTDPITLRNMERIMMMPEDVLGDRRGRA